MVLGIMAGYAQNNVPKPTKDSIVYKGVTDQSCAVEVQFGSYSAGIDGKAYDKVIALIDSYKLKYTSKNIGREGETRLCLPLTELNKRKKKKFIDQLKKTARTGYLTSISIR
jgi:hypothetical protein